MSVAFLHIESTNSLVELAGKGRKEMMAHCILFLGFFLDVIQHFVLHLYRGGDRVHIEFINCICHSSLC